MHGHRLVAAALVALLAATTAPAVAQQPSSAPSNETVGSDAGLARLVSIPPEAKGASGHIDPEAATRAYLATLPPDKKARSDAYFEGGYWLLLWDFAVGAAIYLLLLGTGWSARMRDAAERVSRWRWAAIPLYWAMFLVATTVLGFPLAAYEGFIREHQYGLSNLTFGGWLWESIKGLLVGLVLGGIAMTVFYLVVRRTGRRWWVWGAAIAIVFLVVSLVISPVLILPLFNTPKKLTDQRVVQPILRMARANGIGATEVWEVDASKQTSRISANVSGGFGTERITLNDNLLNRGSLPEIEAVMGHEMGHYVMNHVYKLLIELGVLVVIGFALIDRVFEQLRVRYASRWRVQGVGDVAGLPLIALLFSTYLFLITPVTNTIVRTTEYEADVFGLNAARQPDGFAQAALDLSQYRKMEPGPLEEMIFYDHPSGRTRIYTAMRWKAENLRADSGTAR